MPGITNPAEEYFKDGLWAWVTDQWKKLVATAGGALHIQFAGQEVDVEVTQAAAADLTPGVCGWDGDSWHKLPLLFGYSSQYMEVEVEWNVDAGDVTFTFSAVPDGEIWVIQHFSGFAYNSNASYVILKAVGTAATIYLKASPTVTANETVQVQCPFILKKDDYLLVTWSAAAANDSFQAFAMGYKMKIAE